jgi:hypothetical protein
MWQRVAKKTISGMEGHWRGLQVGRKTKQRAALLSRGGQKTILSWRGNGVAYRWAEKNVYFLRIYMIGAEAGRKTISGMEGQRRGLQVGRKAKHFHFLKVRENVAKRAENNSWYGETLAWPTGGQKKQNKGPLY